MPSPRAMPSWWAVLTRPEAAPASSAGTPAIPALVSGANARPCPRADQHHRDGHGQQVGVGDVGPAQPRHPDQGQRGAGCEQARVRPRVPRRGIAMATAKLTSDMGRKPKPAWSGVKPSPSCMQLGGEVEEADHGPEVEHAGCVGAAALAAGEEPQRHDRLLGTRLVEDQCDQQGRTGHERRDHARRAPADLGGLDDAEHESSDAERRADGPEHVEPPGRRGVSTSTARAPTIMATAMGTLTRKAARQETRSVSAPPTSKPRLAPMPAVAPYQATARLRVSPSKYAVISAREVGATIAAPTPCNALAAIIQAPLGASPISPTRRRRSRGRRRTGVGAPRCPRRGHPAAADRRRPGCRRPAPRRAAVVLRSSPRGCSGAR